jgi:transposase-like protein
MLDENIDSLSGKVECDETFVGGKAKNMHKSKREKLIKGRGAVGKTVVAGAVERQGRVVVKVVPDTLSDTLIPFVTEKVLPESMVFTDESPSYNPLSSQGYDHKRVHHASKVYVIGDVHTNTIEGFWSLVKGGIGGVYHLVSTKYLQDYFNEYAFRYNRRNDDMPMFWSVMTQVEKSSDKNQ